MRPTMWVATYTGFATGRVIKYDIVRRTSNDKYLIADFGGPSSPKWRVLHIKNGIVAGGPVVLDRPMLPWPL